MSQDWTDDVFAAGHAGQTDLQNMEDNFACLKSLFSGDSAPAGPVAGMPWFETDNKVLKLRDAANSAWLGLMHGDASQKMWVYRNSAMDGWVVDSSVSDKVLAIKGGTTYTTGAAAAGSWTISGITANNHTHTGPSHNHNWAWQNTGTADGFGDYDNLQMIGYYSYNNRVIYGQRYVGGGTYTSKWNPYPYTDNGGTGNTGNPSTQATTSDGLWRIAAEVGTLQYLNL